MVIKGTVVGVCIINDLELKISGGQFFDLDATYSPNDIRKSMTPPKGGLYTAFKNNLIEEADSDSVEVLRWRQLESAGAREKARAEKRKEPSAEMRDYHKMEKADKVAYIDALTPRDVKLMERLRTDEPDREMLDFMNRKLASWHDQVVPEGFVLL